MNSIPTFLRQLFPTSFHGRIILVGGCVRDHLLARDSRDIDLLAVLTGAELASCGFRMVTGKSTAPIWFRHDTSFGAIELTRLDDAALLEQNLARRDFTINALAMNLEGALFDPLGGRTDLERGVLRACSKQSFRNDPLRIFRAFRFEADGWRMTSETGLLIREQDWTDCLERIPVERFSRELLKACAAAEPQRFFRMMLEYQVGTTYLPELFRMPLIPAGPAEHHPEGDLLTHSLQVLQRAAKQSDDPLARFCALLHDIGKLATGPDCYPRHHGHDRAGFDLAPALCNRLRLPARYGTALAWTSLLHGTFTRWDQLKDSTRIRMAGQAINAGITRILPLVSAADKGVDREPSDWETVLRIARMTTAELGIEPQQLAGIPTEQRQDFILQKGVLELRKDSRDKGRIHEKRHT
jgi:tRNA nucleotidyltransferase (CCA-adding enzyme)